MTTSKRLAAFRAAQPSDDNDEGTTLDRPEDGEPEVDSSKKKDKLMTTETDQAAIDAARAEGFTTATARFDTVLASEHYAGREALAKTLLANEKLGADEIVTALEAAPKAAVEAPAANTDDADAAARAAMREAIAESGNSGIEANGGGQPQADKSAASASVWDKARAKVFPNQGK